ncbi:hypothetical protein BJ878DRAFT_417476 [Calycina marina]|uniref:Uncharacterized protein n=1 Tax=Calycina marina TaxID=1763456 RepID=A0A9P7Z6F3_9HELO|nr:hypothetical protein BJ878DRAFT_417476 [Calycina marina]
MGQRGYSRATTIQDGFMIGCYVNHTGPQLILTTVKSINVGNDWTVIGSIATANQGSVDLNNCHVHQISSGHVLAAFKNHDRIASCTGDQCWV